MAGSIGASLKISSILVFSCSIGISYESKSNNRLESFKADFFYNCHHRSGAGPFFRAMVFSFCLFRGYNFLRYNEATDVFPDRKKGLETGQSCMGIDAAFFFCDTGAYRPAG